MAINFPDSPTNGQSATLGGNTWTYNSTSGAWARASSAGGSSITTYDSTTDLPLSGVSAGDQAFVTGSNRMYVSNGTGWYSVSLVNTNPSITSVQDSDGGSTPFTLATDGTGTVITITASDPEDVPLTYSYSVTSGSLTNGGGTTATVVQGTDSDVNKFTITPSSTEAYAGTFELTFTASDGINQGTSANSFTLQFITTVTNSNYTTLLATATDTSDNNNITDASTNNHSITVTGDTHAGTFSPYRSGGYSTYFDGTGDWLELTGTALGNGNFTVEAWVWLDSLKDYNVIYDDRATGSSATGLALGVMATGAPYLYTNNGFQITSSQTCTAKTWHHISLVRSSGVITLYLDGTSRGTYSSSANFTDTNLGIGVARTYTVTSQFGGYIRDVRAVVGSAITPLSGGPTERLGAVTNTSLLTCHLPYIADGSTNDHSITINGNVSTKPFSPYDYLEYSATDHGGSVYFDGSGDYLQCANDFSTFFDNSWTIEFWAYLNSLSTSNAISIGDGSGADGMYLLHGGNAFYLGSNSSWNISSYTSSTIRTSQWHHCAVTWDGSDYRIFIDGVLENTATSSAKLGPGPYTIAIGATYNGGQPTNGYLSDIKMTTSALYTTDFTPPTAPLSSSGTSLHIKGTDASIIDKSQGNNLKLIGNTTGSTTQVKFADTKSMYFDGTGDYLTTGNNSNLNLGTGALTVELWYYLTNSQNHTLFELHDGYPNGGGTSYDNNRAKMAITFTNIFLNDGTANVGNYAETQVINQWRHWAWSRDASGNNRFYLNGTQIGTTVSSSNNLITPVVDLGRRAETNSTFMQGYIQDFRITKGLARYTADFTPPTASLEG